MAGPGQERLARTDTPTEHSRNVLSRALGEFMPPQKCDNGLEHLRWQARY